MKRFALSASLGLSLLLLVLLACPPGMAQPADGLAQIEHQLFSRDYASEPIEDRLVRLEAVVFGQSQQGDTQRRQAQLESILQKNQSKATAASSQDKTATPQAVSTPQPKADDATDYPAVTQMEQKLLGQQFSQEPITQRLARLEKKVFQQTFDELPMVDRVDQLSLKIAPEGALGREESAMLNLPETGKELAAGNLAVYSKLTAMEEQILGKSFGGELIANRLARLEQELFGLPQKGAVDDRLDNLIARYTSMNPRQRSQTAQPQVYVPNGQAVPQGLVQPTPPKQVTVGSMFGQYKMSEEMLNMLPAHVRQQLQSNGSGSVVGGGSAQSGSSSQVQVYTGPGTWTHRTEIIAPNSIYTHPGQIYQGYGYPPGMAMPYAPQQQMMVPYAPMNPMGQLQTMPGYGSALIPSPLQGDTAGNLQQSITMLESQILGRTYPANTVLQRLNNLEQQVFGRTYPTRSYQQRINRLMQQSAMRQGALPGMQNQSGLKGALGQAVGMFLYNQMNGTNGYSNYGYGGVPYYQQQNTMMGW